MNAENENDVRLYAAAAVDGLDKVLFGYVAARNLEEATKAFEDAQKQANERSERGSPLDIVNSIFLRGKLKVKEVYKVGNYRVKLERIE